MTQNTPPNQKKLYITIGSTAAVLIVAALCWFLFVGNDTNSEDKLNEYINNRATKISIIYRLHKRNYEKLQSMDISDHKIKNQLWKIDLSMTRSYQQYLTYMKESNEDIEKWVGDKMRLTLLKRIKRKIDEIYSEMSSLQDDEDALIEKAKAS